MGRLLAHSLYDQHVLHLNVAQTNGCRTWVQTYRRGGGSEGKDGAKLFYELFIFIHDEKHIKIYEKEEEYKDRMNKRQTKYSMYVHVE